jgi:hypothetical protein
LGSPHKVEIKQTLQSVRKPLGFARLDVNDFSAAFDRTSREVTDNPNGIARSTSSSVRGLGAGLFPAWADPDYGWESNVSGEAAF